MIQVLRRIRTLARKPTFQDTIYVGPADNDSVDRDIILGRRPCPEYLLFARRNGGRLLPYDIFADGLDAAPGSRTTNNVQALLGALNTSPGPLAVVTTTEHIGHAVAGYAASLGLSMPLNVITHGFLFRDRARMLSLAAFGNVRFLCLSEKIRRRCVEAFGVPEARALNTGFGVDVQFFRPSSTFEFEPTIVSAGAAQRDYGTLLNAVAGISAKVVIAADSAWSNHVSAVRPDSLPSNVSFGSCGNYINLRSLYDAATCVVVPLYDVPRACGYAVISEAMAMGRAVIATKTQCHSDMVVDGVTGFYVNPGDAEQLRKRITSLLQNRQLAEKMGTAGRSRVCELFSVDRYCDRLAASVYDLPQSL